jgi:hypothetical protein
VFTIPILAFTMSDLGVHVAPIPVFTIGRSGRSRSAGTRSHRQLALENLALRHQLAVYKRTVTRPKVRRIDRLFWVWLARVWAGWRQPLVIVTPATVLRWQRRRFCEYWTTLSRRPTRGRPPVNAEIKALVTRMVAANPFWGAHESTGSSSSSGSTWPSAPSPGSPTAAFPSASDWRTFLTNHASDLVAIRFLHRSHRPPVRVLFVLVVLAHHRRRVTEHPTATWTAQPLIEAFPDASAPSYRLRDRDRVYGHAFSQRVKGMGIREVLTAPHRPWRNPFVERLIGSVRRDCLDHVGVLGERHLRHILTALCLLPIPSIVSALNF